MENSILNKLIQYNRNGSYPWHMPGHKRRMQTIFSGMIENPFLIDMTEIKGLDEFHCPEGIIKNAFEKASKIYGSDASFYLINGSTCGILTAISSLCRHGDEIIVARNCHTSVYYAIRLLNLKPIYIMPDWNERLQMFGGVKPETVKKTIKKHPCAKMVIIVSPTYEGVVSDVEKIAKIVHKVDIPLVVDEAHGAHFEYMSNVNETISSANNKKLPVPAIKQGADIVIESLHKTLPALTQCAILHVKSSFVKMDRVKEFLSVYQTSSPSYVFMASMEACIDKMNHERDGLFIIYKELLLEYRKKFYDLKKIHFVGLSDFKGNSGYSYDIGKLVFSVLGCGIKKEGIIKPLTGQMLGKILDEEYGQIMEMTADSYIIAMTSIADTKEAFQSLYEALESIDNELIDLTEIADMYNEETICYGRIPEYRLDIGTALDSQHRKIKLCDAVGKISGEYIYVYPPGIPIVAPGEVFSHKIIKELTESIRQGVNVKGIIIDDSKEKDMDDRLSVHIINEETISIKRKKIFNHR